MDALAPVGMPMELLTQSNLSDEARDRKALVELERVFLKELLKEMRATIPESEGMFKKSTGTKMFEDMMYDVFAGQMAESGQLGIADAIQEQIDLQEQALSSSLDAGFAVGETLLPLRDPDDAPAPLFPLTDLQEPEVVPAYELSIPQAGPPELIPLLKPHANPADE